MRIIERNLNKHGKTEMCKDSTFKSEIEAIKDNVIDYSREYYTDPVVLFVANSHDTDIVDNANNQKDHVKDTDANIENTPVVANNIEIKKNLL